MPCVVCCLPAEAAATAASPLPHQPSTDAALSASLEVAASPELQPVVPSPGVMRVL
jgi:hypothetical protein